MSASLESGAIGTLYGIGTGPGDPELMTHRATRILRECPVVAYFCKAGRKGNARTTAEPYITAEHTEMAMAYPVTTELPHRSTAYQEQIEAFFDTCADNLAAHLEAGRSVAVLSEGDPFFYGSYMHVHLRLQHRFRSTVVPGVTCIGGGAALLPTPITMRDDILTVLPGTLPGDELIKGLAQADSAVVMKVGSNLPKIRQAFRALGLSDRAWYVERASMEQEITRPLSEIGDDPAPYFSMVVMPGKGTRR